MRGRTDARHHALAEARGARRPDDRAEGRADRVRLRAGAAPRRGDDAPPVPRDRALPSIAHAARPGRHGPRLAASLGDEAELTDVRLRYLRYKPETNIVVHYDVGPRRRPPPRRDRDDGRGRLPRAARREAGEPGARVARRRPRPGALLAHVRRGDPARSCSGSRSTSRCPRSRSRARSCARSSRPPARASTPTGRDATVLAYKPRRRAVLHAGGDVVKLYAKEDEFAAAAHGLRASRASGRTSAPAPGGRARVEARDRPAAPRPAGSRTPEEAAEAAGRLLARAARVVAVPAAARHRRPHS